MITLFKPNETDFSHNGIGNLDYHIINPVVEEELNGLYSFTFRYPLLAPHGLKIDGQSILRVPVPGMEDQLFRVYRPVKSMGYITASCYHIFYDMADNFIEDTNIVEKNGQGALQQLGGATQFGHRFRFFSDISTVANARLVRKNPVASILDDSQANSFVSRWGGELIRNNFDVRMNKSAGSDRGFTVKHRKNLTGYEADVDYSTVITRIMPKGFDGLLLPEKYIDSPLIGDYETPKIKEIPYNDVKAAVGEYANDEDAIPLEDAYAELRRLAKEEYTIHKVDTPTVRYKVDFVMLEQTEEYKDLQDLQQLKMGDMVTVDHEEDNFKVTAKLVHYKYDPVTERYLSAELGSIHDGVTTKFTNINRINRKVEELEERTNEIQNSADGKNTIYRGEDEPANPNIGDLWYKPNGGETEMYQYVEEEGQRFWKLLADTGDLTKVQRDVDEAMEYAVESRNRANEAVENANIATRNATEAIEQAQEGFDKAQEALTTAGDAERLASSVGDLANALQGTVSGHSRQITNIEGELSRKMTTIDADKKYATQSALEQTSERFSSDIVKVQGQIDGLEYENKNLVLNTAGVHEKRTTAVLHFPLDGSKLSEHLGEKVTVSFRIKGVGNSGNVDVYFRNDGAVVNSGRIMPFPISNTEWKYVKETFIVTQEMIDNTKQLGFRANNNGGTGNRTFDVKEVQVEKGDKATDYGPAPEDIQYQFSSINQTVLDITTRVGDSEGNISTLQQTASSLATQLSNAKGDISSVTQLATGLQRRVADAEGNISSVTQLAGTLQTDLRNAKGDINTLTETASSMQRTITSVQDDLANLDISEINLISKSDQRVTSSSYMVKEYFINEDFIFDETYTVVFKGSIASGQEFGLWQNAGSNGRGRFESLGNGLYRLTFKSLNTTSGNERRVRIYNVPDDSSKSATIEWIKFVRGNKTSLSWQPAPEDMATQSQITQLAKDINLRVKEGDVINQINIDTSGVLLSGKKLTLDGDTTVLGTFRVGNANITDLVADKITVGTLNGANVNIINLNASNIVSGSLSANRISGGILQSTNGGLTLNLNNSNLSMGSGQLTFGGTGNNFNGRIDYTGEAFRFQRDPYTYLLINRGGSTGGAGVSSRRNLFGLMAKSTNMFRFGLTDDGVDHSFISGGNVGLKFLNGSLSQLQVRNYFDGDYADLRAQNIEAMGNLTSGGRLEVQRGASFYTSASYTYLTAPNNNHFIRFTNSTGYIAFGVNNSVIHAFRPDGTKIGGSILIDGKRLGMSPIDSPRVLLADMILNVKLKAGITQEIVLNNKLQKAISDLGVFPSHPVEIIKKGNSFVVTADKDMTVDFMIYGTRVGEENTYWQDMEENIQEVA